jgi:hypothetical protein
LVSGSRRAIFLLPVAAIGLPPVVVSSDPQALAVNATVNATAPTAMSFLLAM